MAVSWDEEENNENLASSEKGEVPEKIFSDEDIKKLIEETQKQQKSATSNCFNCLIIGNDGTGKSGIVMDYMSKLPKKSIIIDLDGGNAPIYESYYKNTENKDKIVIITPLEIKSTKDDVVVDYKRTLAKIKAIVKYMKANYIEFSAIAIDGLSSLLKDAEYLMRIEKNIAPDGGVQLRYWINRSKVFTEILEMLKSIPLIDKFYIGHEDFIMKDEMAAVKSKTNQMIHQRIICEKRTNLDKVEFVARIDKSKYNISLEGKEYKFASINHETKKVEWNASEIFKGLK
jgi:hypothetical protein